MPGIRNEGDLDSALNSPKNHHAYGKPDVFELAGQYAFALVRDHPFKDGNKRVALTVAGVFLERNGYRLLALEADAVAAVVALSMRKLDAKGFAAWMRSNSSKSRATKSRGKTKGSA